MPGGDLNRRLEASPNKRKSVLSPKKGNPSGVGRLTLVGGDFQSPVEVATDHKLGGEEDVVNTLPGFQELKDKWRVDSLEGLAVEREHDTHRFTIGEAQYLLLFLLLLIMVL